MLSSIGRKCSWSLPGPELVGEDFALPVGGSRSTGSTVMKYSILHPGEWNEGGRVSSTGISKVNGSFTIPGYTTPELFRCHRSIFCSRNVSDSWTSLERTLVASTTLESKVDTPRRVTNTRGTERKNGRVSSNWSWPWIREPG